MSEQTRANLEEALIAHTNDEFGSTSRMMSEYLIFVSTQDMTPGKENITGYSWWCNQNITQGHLFGLLEMGKRLVEEDYNDPHRTVND